MAVSVEAKIAEALFARLAALTFTPALPVAYPNLLFTPPADGKWLRVTDIPASANPIDLRGATIERVGLMQVDVFRPLNEGMTAGREIAGKIVDHFKPSRPALIRDGVKVKVTRAWTGPTLIEGGTVQIPVTIRYRSFV